ncbi:MAG TPA: ATP-binding protein, partial [Thermoanaerobaculia bacterium]
SMQLHVVDERLPADSPAKALVTNVVALIRRVADEGRQAVSGLRTGDDSALEQALARVKHDLDVEHAVDFRVIVTGRSRPLHPLMRDELYRIGREALVNAFRHADAHNVEVELEYRSAELTMRVRDDGRGIDPDVLHAGREGHWGLIGIRERAERIGARLRVSSRAGAGTEVELVVPGTAYLAGARRSTSRRVNPES